MYDTFEEVKGNVFINNLEETAQAFGLHGVYVKWQDNDGLDGSSIYFVVGSDKEKVFSKKLNIDEYFDERSKDSDYLHLDMGVVKLTDCSPFATHQAVAQYCRDVEFVKDIFTAYNRPIPKKIDFTSLMYLKTIYERSIDKMKNPEVSDIYRENVGKYIEKIEDKLENISETSRDFDGYFKNVFKNYKNQVSLDELLDSSKEIVKHVISADLLPKFKEAMKEHPDILFYSSKVNKVIFRAPENEFGDESQNIDFSTATIAYDSTNKKDIALILSEIAYPEAFKVSVQEMRKIDNKLCCFGVQEDEYHDFADLCKRNNIHYSMNDEEPFYGDDSNLINIVFYKKDIPKIDKILQALATKAESYHIFTEDTSLKIGNDITLAQSPIEEKLAAQGINVSIDSSSYDR